MYITFIKWLNATFLHLHKYDKSPFHNFHSIIKSCLGLKIPGYPGLHTHRVPGTEISDPLQPYGIYRLQPIYILIGCSSAFYTGPDLPHIVQLINPFLKNVVFRRSFFDFLCINICMECNLFVYQYLYGM